MGEAGRDRLDPGVREAGHDVFGAKSGGEVEVGILKPEREIAHRPADKAGGAVLCVECVEQAVHARPGAPGGGIKRHGVRRCGGDGRG